MREANRFILFSLIPVFLLFSASYILFYGIDNLTEGFKEVWDLSFIFYIAGGILLHEGLHGLSMGLAAPGGFRSISFGFEWFAFYTHCNEAIKKPGFQTGVILPWIVTGLIPFLFALVSGSTVVLFLSIIFTWGAAGDFLVWRKTLKLKGKGKILDHPKELGFYYYPDYHLQ